MPPPASPGQPPSVPGVTASGVTADAYLLDVREPEEWRAGHAPTAQHIPLGELAARLPELPADREIVCVCRMGGRSAQAAALLAGRGYRVANLEGGMTAWQQAGRDLVSELAAPPQVI